MAKKISYGENAVGSLHEGVKKLSNAVKRTLGGKGSFVLIDKDFIDYPYATKDGVTVANAVELTNPQESQGASLMKHVAKMTNEEVGDGTTTSIVLAEALIRNGKAILTGNKRSTVKFVQGMQKATDAIIEHLKSTAITVEDNPNLLERVARISANGDEELGRLVIDAFNEVGTAGIIKVGTSQTGRNFIQVEKGYKMESGLMSHYFIPPNKLEADIDNPYIIVSNLKINNMSSFVESNALNNALASGRKVILVCNEIEELLFQKLTMNFVKSGVHLYLVKAPSLGIQQHQQLHDLSVALGATFIDEQQGLTLKDIEENDFGTCERVIVDTDETSFIKGGGTEEAIKEAVEFLQEKIDSGDAENEEALKDSIARLTGKVANIYIDSSSQVEYQEVVDRLEDAINATRVAYESGVVAGGGVALLTVKKTYMVELLNQSTSEDESAGIRTVFNSIDEPFFIIMDNAGLNGSDYTKEILNTGSAWQGVDCVSGKVGNMEEMGIIDPLKVTITALQNAVKVAGIILNTSCTITYELEE